MPPPPRILGQLDGLAVELTERQAVAGGPAGLGRAACAGLSPTHDLDVDGETRDARTERHERARAICATCPVLAACGALAASLPADEATGVWAGTLRGQPASLPRQCRRCSSPIPRPRRRGSWPIYCSAPCRPRQPAAARVDGAPSAPDRCAWCDGQLAPYRGHGMRPLYCSTRCRRTSTRDRARERQNGGQAEVA